MIESKLSFSEKLRIKSTLDYDEAPLCKYNRGNCVCKKQIGDGPIKCFSKKGPQKCWYEKEQSRGVLNETRSINEKS